MYTITGLLFLTLCIVCLYLCSAAYVAHICETRNAPFNILTGFFVFIPIINTILSIYFGLKTGNYKESLIKLFK